MVPTTPGETGALTVICGVFCLANPVDVQLPNTVFHLSKNVIYAGHALGRTKDGNRRRIVKRCDRCSEPPKGSVLVTQNFSSPCDCLRQFLGVCLSSSDHVCQSRRSPGYPHTTRQPECARPPRPDSFSRLRHQFDSTAAISLASSYSAHLPEKAIPTRLPCQTEATASVTLRISRARFATLPPYLSVRTSRGRTGIVRADNRSPRGFPRRQSRPAWPVPPRAYFSIAPNA